VLQDQPAQQDPLDHKVYKEHKVLQDPLDPQEPQVPLLDLLDHKVLQDLLVQREPLAHREQLAQLEIHLVEEHSLLV
jgi:hypothetical protein